MKTSIFKRSMALFLAFLLCFTTFIGSAVTPAFAAGTESEVVLIGFPRDGDCQRRCNFVVFRRTDHVEKWRVNVYSL